MKIKFIKQFRCIDIDKDGIDVLIEAGQTAELDRSESAQWLIDNGFAEEVKQPSWEKPTRGDDYYFIESDGETTWTAWANFLIDESRHSMGNCFSTKGAAERYRDYLKAVATVRQDEGVIDLQGVREEYEATPENKYDEFCVYTVAFNLYLRKLVATDADEYISANAIWFEDKEYAQSSLDKHQDEWKIIANYDWSRE